MRNLLIEAQAGEPAPRQMHAQFFHQLAFARDAVQIADQQNAQQELVVFPSRRRHTICLSDLSSDVCSSDLLVEGDSVVVSGNAASSVPGLPSRLARSEERRVGKECRSRRAPAQKLNTNI